VTARARLAEKVPAVAGFGHRLRLLPWWDGRGDEPPDFRRSVRKMVHESNVKGALLDKVFSVASLDLQVHPASDDARDGLIADGFRACFEGWTAAARLLRGGHPQRPHRRPLGLREGVAGPGARQVARPVGLRRRSSSRTARNWWPTSSTTCGACAPSPGASRRSGTPPTSWSSSTCPVRPLAGTSDLRAAYKAWWLIENVDEMRALAAEKFSTPFLQGEYPPGEDDVRRALESGDGGGRRADVGVTIPMGTRLTMLDLATRGQADYQAFKDDQRRDVYLGICGAVLQAVEGTTTGGRGNSQVHRGTADTRAWYVASVAAELIGRQMVPDYVDANYLGSPEYPTVTIGSVNDAEMTASLAVDSGLQDMGYDLSKKELGKRYGRQWASSPDDVLRKPAGGPRPRGWAGQSLSRRLTRPRPTLPPAPPTARWPSPARTGNRPPNSSKAPRPRASASWRPSPRPPWPACSATAAPMRSAAPAGCSTTPSGRRWPRGSPPRWPRANCWAGPASACGRGRPRGGTPRAARRSPRSRPTSTSSRAGCGRCRPTCPGVFPLARADAGRQGRPVRGRRARPAFTVAGITEESLLARIKDVMAGRLETGQALGTAPAEIRAVLEEAGSGRPTWPGRR
jgi:hypothetical protein